MLPDENFSFKQDRSSSHRNAEQIFIDFITIRGTVQDQHVCTPSYCPVLTHWALLCVCLWRVLCVCLWKMCVCLWCVCSSVESVVCLSVESVFVFLSGECVCSSVETIISPCGWEGFWYECVISALLALKCISCEMTFDTVVVVVQDAFALHSSIHVIWVSIWFWCSKFQTVTYFARVHLKTVKTVNTKFVCFSNVFIDRITILNDQ